MPQIRAEILERLSDEKNCRYWLSKRKKKKLWRSFERSFECPCNIPPPAICLWKTVYASHGEVWCSTLFSVWCPHSWSRGPAIRYRNRLSVPEPKWTWWPAILKCVSSENIPSDVVALHGATSDNDGISVRFRGGRHEESYHGASSIGDWNYWCASGSEKQGWIWTVLIDSWATWADQWNGLSPCLK